MLAERNYVTDDYCCCCCCYCSCDAVTFVDCDLLTSPNESWEMLFVLWLWHPEICHLLWVLVGGETFFLSCFFFIFLLTTQHLYGAGGFDFLCFFN